MASLKLSGRMEKVRILIDPGASKSRISYQLVRKLHLEIMMMNDTSIVTLSLQGIESDVIEVVAEVTSNYKIQAPSRSVDPKVTQLFPGAMLADPEFFKSTTVEISLGMDVYPRIIRTGVLAGTLHPLLAQYSVFGYLVSGTFQV